MALDNFELWQRHNFSRNKCSKVSAPPLLFTNEHFVMQTLKRTFGFRTGFLCFLWVQRGPWRSLGSLLKISDHHFYFCFFFIIGVAHFQWKKKQKQKWWSQISLYCEVNMAQKTVFLVVFNKKHVLSATLPIFLFDTNIQKTCFFLLCFIRTASYERTTGNVSASPSDHKSLTCTWGFVIFFIDGDCVFKKKAAVKKWHRIMRCLHQIITLQKGENEISNRGELWFHSRQDSIWVIYSETLAFRWGHSAAISGRKNINLNWGKAFSGSKILGRFPSSKVHN